MGCCFLRLYIKKQILELLDTLADGIVYIREKPEPMLKNCIDAVTSIKALLQSEQEVEAVNKTDHLLENLKNMKTSGFQDICNKIKPEIKTLKLFIKENVKTQYEIAFFPYKVSMWDSMESIWRAANNDPDCICYVVPIPYYSKKDGSKAEYFYEGSLYPDDVPVVHYSLYDVQKHHPDIVYIHNPYDNNNYVTQVDEKYFAENLKKSTDMLVYVPYFVYGSYRNIDEIKTMAIVPGTVYADRVIAQSEYQKKLFTKLGLNEGKMLVAGSPKFDAVLRAEEQPHEIPKEWEEKLKGKKIFLWNTTIRAMLENPGWLEKSGQLMDILTQCPECALIWRPHPLLKETIKSMRPAYLEPYLNLAKEVMAKSNAVIDLTGNAYISMAASDAIVSDYSSIMLQYAVTGKPILCLDRKSSMLKNSICIFDYSEDYFLENGMTIKRFRDMVLKGEDPKKRERLKVTEKSIANIDGACGQKVHTLIKQEACNNL